MADVVRTADLGAALVIGVHVALLLALTSSLLRAYRAIARAARHCGTLPPTPPPHCGQARPPAALLAPRPGAMPQAPLEKVASAIGSWCPIDWSDIVLRVGPDYRRNKRKALTSSPALDCVGVDAFHTLRKVFSDGELDAGCLPPEILAATRRAGHAEPTAAPAAAASSSAPPPPAAAARLAAPPPLPEYLVVSVSMPTYDSPAPDGPGMKFNFYYAVPRELRAAAHADPSARCGAAFPAQPARAPCILSLTWQF